MLQVFVESLFLEQGQHYTVFKRL